MGLAAALALGLASVGCRSDPFGSTPPPTSEEEWKLLVLRARTEHELSALLGVGPRSCEPLVGTPLVHCRWIRDFRRRTDAHLGSEGNVVLTRTDGFAVHVDCRLPAGGGARDRDSCDTRLVF